MALPSLPSSPSPSCSSRWDLRKLSSILSMVSKKAWGIALIGAMVPFGCGYLCGYIFWADEGWRVHLAIATAVTATAVSLTMVVLHGVGLIKTRASIGIMTSAVLDDVGCLILVAVLTPIMAGKEAPTALGTLWIIGKVAIFFIIIIILHKVILPHDVKEGIVSKIPFFRTYGIKHLLAFKRGDQVSLVVVCFGLAVGMIGLALGFHPTVGAYFAGLILDERYFDVRLKRKIINTMEKAKDIVGSASFMWLGPVFFVHLGANLHVDLDELGTAIPQALAISAILFVGQLSSATIAARYVPGGFSWVESGLIGLGMLGRAELYFVVLNIAHNEHIIGDKIFFPMALAAMFMNIILPISISLYRAVYVKYHPISTAEIADEEVGSPVVGLTESPAGEVPPEPVRRRSEIARRGIGMSTYEVDYMANPWWMEAEEIHHPPQRTRSAMSYFDHRRTDSFREPQRGDSFVEPSRTGSFVMPVRNSSFHETMSPNWHVEPYPAVAPRHTPGNGSFGHGMSTPPYGMEMERAHHAATPEGS